MTKNAVQLQSRDIAVLTDLRNLTILSLDQIRRLHWPEASREICRKRLSRLMNHGERWLRNFTVPKPEMEAVGLQPGQVYYLSETGRAWFRGQERPPGKLPRQRQALHDLLISEWFVRLSELARARQANLGWRADWQVRFYRSPNAERATLVPDGLAILTGLTPQPLAMFLELDFSREAHGRPSSRIGRKIRGYDAYLKQWFKHAGLDGLDYFPAVIFLTHGRQRLENLAAAVLKHRRENVAYGLALTGQVYQVADPLAAPVWRLIPAHRHTVSEPRPMLDSRWLASLQANLRPPLRLLQVAKPPETPPPSVQAATSAPAPPQPAKSPRAMPAPVNLPATPAPKPPATVAPSARPKLLCQTPILPAEVVIPTRRGLLANVAHRLSVRRAGTRDTGCVWSNQLLQQAVAVGIPVQWQPLPPPARELFNRLKLPPPPGCLTLAGVSLFTDHHFARIESLPHRLAAYRELAFLWTEQQFRPSFPRWTMLILPEPKQAKAFFETAQQQRRIINFCATTQVEFTQSSLPLLSTIWRLLPAQQTCKPVSLEGRPLLAWSTAA